VNLCELDSRG